MTSDESMKSLKRYFSWAETIEGELRNNKALYSTGHYPNPYLALWAALMYIVIEGWKELKLSEPKIDNLLQSPFVDKLRRYRNGVFHFQKDIYDEHFLEFMRFPIQGKSGIDWLFDLSDEFKKFFKITI